MVAHDGAWWCMVVHGGAWWRMVVHAACSMAANGEWANLL